MLTWSIFLSNLFEHWISMSLLKYSFRRDSRAFVSFAPTDEILPEIKLSRISINILSCSSSRTSSRLIYEFKDFKAFPIIVADLTISCLEPPQKPACFNFSFISSENSPLRIMFLRASMSVARSLFCVAYSKFSCLNFSTYS